MEGSGKKLSKFGWSGEQRRPIGGVFKSQGKVSHVRYRKQALSEHETFPRQVPTGIPPQFSFSNPNTYDGTGDGPAKTAHGTKLTQPAPFCTLFAKARSGLRLLSVVATTATCGQQLDRWSTETVYYGTSGGGGIW